MRRPFQFRLWHLFAAMHAAAVLFALAGAIRSEFLWLMATCMYVEFFCLILLFAVVDFAHTRPLTAVVLLGSVLLVIFAVLLHSTAGTAQHPTGADFASLKVAGLTVAFVGIPIWIWNSRLR